MPLSQLKLLLVEDSSLDAELILLTLENSGLKIDATLVYNHQDVERELLAENPLQGRMCSTAHCVWRRRRLSSFCPGFSASSMPSK
jgi:hypothetical protein